MSSDAVLTAGPNGGRVLWVGTVIHGFCRGYFGRDSYLCRTIEAVGRDWIVTRNSAGAVELGRDLAAIAEYADDRSYCSDSCTGDGERGDDW